MCLAPLRIAKNPRTRQHEELALRAALKAGSHKRDLEWGELASRK